MAGLKWDLRPSRLFAWLGDIRRRQVEAATMRVATRMAREIEAYMRQNARWTDRTGDARRLLKAEVLDVTGRAAFILLQHGVEYGVFLEMRPAYAIIGPTLDVYGPRIMRELQIELAGGTFGGV
jgi:hypothetical protein